MKNPLSILLALDGDHDDQALLAEIVSIASESSSRVTVLSIVEPPIGDPGKDVAVANLQEWEAKVRSMQLDNLSAQLSASGIEVTIEHAVGKPYLEIIRKTLDKSYNLVIKPAKREAGLRQLLLGGTDIQLMSLCPVPVWIFQPTLNRSLKKIAVAVDLQADDPERSALAGRVLEWGKCIAAASAAELHVIHAWSFYREASLRSKSAFSDTVDRLVVGKERVHRQWLFDALQGVGLRVSEVHDHLVKGEAKELIPEMAGELDIDLLIMGTVGRTGIPGFFIGNTADSILRKVSCSVLAIKPEKFLTPVVAAAVK